MFERTSAAVAAAGREGRVVIGPEVVAEIVRLYEVEGWRPGTIARHLKIHRDTVKNALRRAGRKVKKSERRSSKLDRFESFVRETFDRYPDVPASVVWRMVTLRGYRGSESHFRYWVRNRELRPRRQPEAFLELRTLPGEQAQVDWGSFGKVQVKGGERNLSAFVMTLSHSRRLFVRFFLNEQMSSFLEGHVLAFKHFDGVARTLLYDNLKSAVLKRISDAMRYNPKLLEFASWYRFFPKPVAPGKGNEKGGVERAIRHLRQSFFTTVTWTDLDDLNRQVLAWCTEVTDQRRWRRHSSLTVLEAYEAEHSKLVRLPGAHFSTCERREVSIGKTPYARFDSNRYTVPHEHVQRKLTLEATSREVRLIADNTVVATHQRSWNKGEDVEEPEHIARLVKEKKNARLNRQQMRLFQAVPPTEDLLCELATRQHGLGVSVDELTRLLDQFGAEELTLAVEEALSAGSPHPGTVRLILDRRRVERGQRPPVPVDLPDDARVRDLVVKPHDLADYDQLSNQEDDNEL